MGKVNSKISSEDCAKFLKKTSCKYYILFRKFVKIINIYYFNFLN